MIANKKLIGSALCLATTLFAANIATAQSANANPAAGAKAATPEAIFDRWDKDKNKSLSLDEFRAGWQEVQMGALVRKLHGNFVSMDTNKSGSLEANEFANLELVKKSKTPVQFASFDTDKNQKIDFKEYVGMIKAMAPAKR